MAQAKIQSLLQDLCEYLPSEGQAPTSNKGDEKAIATDIANLAMSEVPDTDLDFVASLLFQSQQSLLVYLRGNVNSRDSLSVTASCTLLDFIVSFIPKAGNVLQPYAVAIKNCMIKMASNGSGRVRASAIDVLGTLLDTNTSKLNVDELKISDMFNHFSRDFTLAVTKTPPSVKGRILDLLGLIIRYHSDMVSTANIQTVQRWCFSTLEEQLFSSKSAENTLMQGALGGLDALLYSSKATLDPEAPQIGSLYNCIRALFDLPEDLARYSAPIAALKLFNNHTKIFQKYLIRDSEQLYKALITLCEHRNRDISSLGYRTMENLLKEVSSQLMRAHAGSEERRSFNFFLNNFIRYLRTDYSEVSFRGLSVAIRGIGFFSRAFAKYLAQDEVEAVRGYLVKISSWFYSEYNNNQEAVATHLPSFIQAYDYFAASLSTIPPTFMTTIVKIIDVFVLSYPKVTSVTRSTGLFAVRDLLRTLYRKGEGTLRGFLNAFMYNALVVTCSDDDPSDDQRPYMDFIHFWEFVLNSRTTDDDDSHFMDMETILFDEFLTALLRLVKTFNLDLQKVENENDESMAVNEVTATPSMLRAVNEKHFVMFHNTVDFWCLLLPKLNSNRLKSWMYLSASALIDLSIRRPLVSGFYKMLSAILSIAAKHNLFKGHKELFTEQQQRKQLGAICDLSATQTDLFSAYVIFRDFLKEVWHRLQQFKDDLLASCLGLVLAYPLVFFDTQELVAPIQTAFRLGLTVHSLSDIALDVLDELITEHHDSAFFAQVLPCMNEYLLMDLRSKEDLDQPIKKWKAETGNARRRRDIHFKATADTLGAVATDTVSLRDIQLRVMRFLGRIGGMNKLMLNNDGESTLHQLLAWDPESKLEIKIPFPNANVKVNMGELLPRICELAESSPDRQVKVAACELLHGLVLAMIGYSANRIRDRNGPTQSPYYRLYKRIFSVLLRLAIDLDQVARDMFRTLTAQLIHWFTNNAHYENPETMALLDTCIDAACSTDAGLRDYGADCIQEFVTWSIKQQSMSRKNTSPGNIKSLLKRLYNYASNPSSKQRLGACIIFNRIYRTFREEDALVSEFTFELMYWIFFSLKLAEDDHPLIGTLDQAKEAISHIKCIIRKKVKVFLTEEKSRRAFPGMETTDLPTLIRWSFVETGKLQREYAREWMKFFDEFVGQIPGSKDGEEWLSKELKGDSNLLIEVYEKNPLMPAAVIEKNPLLWLRQLKCTLDGYVWLLQQNMIKMVNLLDQKSSKCIDACVYLLNHTPEDLFGQQSSVEKTNGQALYTYNYYKLVDFINQAARLSTDMNDILVDLVSRGILVNERFVSLIVQLLLLPNQYIDAAKTEQGDASHSLTAEKIRQVVKNFLHMMMEHGPPKFLRMFSQSCTTMLHSNRIDLTNMQLNQSALNDMVQTIDGIKLLQDLKMFDMVCQATPKSSGGSDSALAYCSSLFDKFNEFNNTTEPVWIDLVGEILKIAFHQRGFAEKHAEDLLLNHSELYTERSAIYQRFNSYINDLVATNFKEFAPVLISHVDDRFIIDVTIGVVEYLRTERNTRKNEITRFIEDLLYNTTFLPDIIRIWREPSKVSYLVKFLKGMFGADPGICSRTRNHGVFSTLCEALEVCLQRDIPLSVKTEAFDLIPMYITISGDHIDKIKKAVDETVKHQLRYRSTDLKPGTEVYNDYINALDKLLGIMSRFNTIWIFQILFPMFVQEANHIHSDAMRKHIGIFAKHLGPSEFKKTIDICFNLFKDTSQEMAWRQATINLIIWLFALVPEGHVIHFYVDNIRYIMSIVEEDLLRRGSDQEIIDDMEEKMCGFRLMQAMYEKLPAIDVHGQNSEIVKAFVGGIDQEGQGRKLTNELVKNAHNAKKRREAPESNPDIVDARLRYHRVAYNAITAAILRTQKAEKFFAGFLLRSNPNEPLWENIVDTTVVFNLPAQLPKRMERIRLEEFKRRADTEKEEIEDEAKYMASIRSAADSLSQPTLADMAVASLNLNSTVADDLPEPMADKGHSLFDTDEEQVTVDRPRSKNTMELDPISENPCMKPLIAVIRRLHRNITPPNEGATDMPDWMKEMNRVFNAPDTSINVRLFLAKAMTMVPEAFEPYAEHWVRPVMKLVREGDKYGEPFNYFVQDACILLVTWGVNVKLKSNYDDRVLLFDFMNYLMENAYNPVFGILKANVQIIKAMFENWAKQIVVPTPIVYKELTTKRPGRGDQVGLQFVGMILAHDIDPFYQGPEVNLNGLTEEQFYMGIRDNLLHKYRDVYGDAAEVLGWVLEYKKKHGKSTEYIEKLIDDTLSRMDPLQLNHPGDEAKFLVCVQRIQLHDRSIIKKYMTKVLYLVSQLYGDLKILALQIIAASSEDIPDLFITLQSKKLLKILSRGNEEIQRSLLMILDKIAGTLNLNQIDQALDALSNTYVSHANQECRLLFYKFLESVNNTVQGRNALLSDRIKVLLLRALVDPNDAIRNNATAYIKTTYGLQQDIYERLKSVLSNMYMPEVENMYILYSTEILLDCCKESHDYIEPLFNAPLPNAKFDKDYQRINTSWQLRNPMTPLFVATQEQTLNTEDFEGGLRATQNTLQFSLTQDGQGSQAGSASLLSSFAPSLTTQDMDIDSVGVDESQQATDDYRRAVGRRKETKYQKIQRRFVKTTQQQESLHFSGVHDRRRKRLQKAAMLQKLAREKRVHMTRQYRIGELPDIQIQKSEIVMPLQVLGRTDNDVGRILLAMLANGITEVVKAHKGERNYKAEITKILQENLEKSTIYFPPAIGSFLRICYDLGGSFVPSQVINTVSQRSNNQSLGIALLEKQIIYHVEDEPQPARKKARKAKAEKLGEDKKQWIDLAKLYKSVDQPEIFQNLYQARVATVSTAKDAIDIEIQGRYADAGNLFVDTYDKNTGEVDPEEERLWIQELLHCYEQLASWQDIAFWVETKFEGDFSLIWDDDEKDEYVNYFMRSYTKLRQGTTDPEGDFSAWTDERPNPVFNFISAATEVPDHMDYLIRHAACDVSLNAIAINEYDRARYYIRHSYDNLLSVWTSLHPLANSSRMAQLAVLERTVELEDFLNLVSDLQRGVAGSNEIEKYMRGLVTRYPDQNLDPMGIWDDIIDARNVFLDEIASMQAIPQMQSPRMEPIIEYRKKLLKSMVSASLQQNNADVASSRITALDSWGIEKQEKLIMQLQARLKEVHLLDDSKQLEKIAYMMGRVFRHDGAMSSSTKYGHEFKMVAGEVFELARKKLQDNPDDAFNSFMSAPSLANLMKSHKFKDAAMLANYVNSSGYRYLQDTYVNTMDKDSSLHAECLWRFAEYCDNVLRANEDELAKFTVKIDPILYSRIVITSYFSAMDLGRKEAIERFPRLLDLIERYPENGHEFKSKAETFGATWMYIRWIPQMMAVLDTTIAMDVFPAIHKLAQSYPNALYYAFNISNDHYKSLGDRLDVNVKNEISKIEEALRSPLLEKFVFELRRLTHPHHILFDFAEFIESICEQPDVNKEFVKAAYDDFHRLFMDIRNNEMGSFPKGFGTSCVSQLREVLGNDGSKILRPNGTQIYRLRRIANEVYNQWNQNKSKPSDLREYSPWLAKFQVTDHVDEIEVPGQYTGLRKPDPARHAKIANFDQRLLVMNSIRVPKRLRIYGTDEHVYDFLVKGGEDLRLDQRIQQLFVVMNELLQNDPYCARHKVNIRTYKVIPMTTKVGMIEWVPDTEPLQVSLNSIAEGERTIRNGGLQYGSYIGKNKRKGDNHGHLTSYTLPRDEIVSTFESISSRISPYLLRDYFLRMVASPEAFLYVRDDFVHSLAAICISGYVLGIGDRHLENFLLDKKSGHLIAIDFGHAFGSATEILPIPELIPFRLTRQLVNVCQPVGVSEMMETPMTYILQTFQTNKAIILNTMDVFIKEPLLDWRKEAIREAHKQRLLSEEGDTGPSDRPSSTGSSTTSSIMDQEIAWYPQQKLDTARRKLARENPSYTMVRDLLRNQRVKPYHEVMKKAVKGDEQFNVRATVGETCATVQEQVRCLIDLATDPAILGRTWKGWKPYV
ncbi:hypothetical protein BJV82DRAFT_554475 [Fennellomyces sp. T-0311]|nr:hypothetical protein BJV82DRAFT_554475 [Fennellomyces sp. T-0311]